MKKLLALGFLIGLSAPAWAGQFFVGSPPATPGGSTTQLQFNNAGVFGGISGVTTNGTHATFAGNDLLLGGAGAGIGTFTWANSATSGTITFPAATDTVALLGVAQTFTNQNTFAAGTITTSQPLTLTQTWNTAGVTFTGLKLNITDTASATASQLMDLQVAGTSKLNVLKSGIINAPSGVGLAANGTTLVQLSTSNIVNINFGVLQLNNVFIQSDAANTLALRNGTNAQTFKTYNTYTDASNYEALQMLWSGNAVYIGTINAGTGSQRSVTLYGSSLNFRTGATTDRWTIDTSGNFLAVADNTYDIGAAGATRPRSLYLGTNATVGGAILNPGISTDATHTDASVCEDTTSHQFYFGSGAAGICLGTSSLRFKDRVAPLTIGLDAVMKLDTISYHYKPGYGDPTRNLYGFAAEQVDAVIPELVGRDTFGKPNSVDWAGMVPVLVRAVQEQQAEIESLRRRIH